MIGFDTNVILRLIVKDDPVQTDIVLRIVDQIEDAGETIFLSDMVLSEVVWTLRKSYKTPSQEIVMVLRELWETETLSFESRDRFAAAISDLDHGRGDFADYLIKEKALDEGCRSLVTFDKALHKHQGFQSQFQS